MGNQTLSRLHCLAAALSLLLITSATACRSATPAASTPASSPEVISTNQITAPPTGTPTTPIQPAVGASLTPSSPAPLSPTPLSPDPLTPAPLTPENAPSLRALKQHDFNPWEHVLGITWSPDGERLAVAAGDSIYIFKGEDLEESLRLEPGTAAPALGFSPDGARLAAGDRSGRLHVWDVQSGEKLHEMQAHQKSISSLAYSPDGSTLATAGYDAVARLWEAESYAEMSEMIGGTFAVPAIAFTPDGSSLAIINGNVIRLRDALTSRFVRTIVGEESFYSLAFSPDGSYLASGDVGNTINIWDMGAAPGPGGETRTSLHTLSGHSGRLGRPEALVWQVVYSPDGSLLASAGGDAVVRVWDAASAQPVVSLGEHSKAVTSAAFSPDGRWLATGGLDGRLVVWGVGN